MEALKVFSSAIGYLKSHVLRACQQKTSGIDEKDIHWVLTIPAIWDDVAKKFMREAAEQVFRMFISCIKRVTFPLFL